jgi:hypothetical protein
MPDLRSRYPRPRPVALALAVATLTVTMLTACRADPPSSTVGPVDPPPPPTVTALCVAPNRPHRVQLGANVNALFWEAHYQDEALLAAVRSLGRPVLRLPGGTEADYFDWTLGRPVDACRYGACRTWDSAQLAPPVLFTRFGSFRNSTPATFARVATRVDGTLLLVANTVTASVDDNVRWVREALAAGAVVPMLELANEPYFGRVEGTDNTERLYPTAASHVAFVRRLAAALRPVLPAARFAYPAFVPRVDPATGGPSAGHDARMLSWNAESLAAGVAPDVDAFALHFYPRLPGRQGATDAAWLRTLGLFASAYWDATRRQAQWALLPGDRRLWITELNASFADAPELVGTWMHALVQAQLMLRLLQDSRVDVVLQHMLTGNPQWQAVVHPGRAPDIVPASGFVPYARTATGEVLAGLAGAVGGATCVDTLPGAVPIASTPATAAVAVRDSAGARVVVVNASSDSLTVDLRAFGWTRATVTERTAAPLERPGAGATVRVASSTVAGVARVVRLAPFSLVTLAEHP